MSVIRLKPLDDGQKAVDIPLGKTTIGRGPFLGCSDKKVSRNHAVLEVTTNGEVYLTPTHVNPCFYQPTADSPGQILKKDVPYKLENGDSFSLLPRAYRYQLIVESGSNQNEDTHESNDKELGKTNGSATDLHEGVSANEELGDTIVPEKIFVKEDSLNIEKNFVKEENNFSKKISDIKDNGEHDFPKNSQEHKSGELVERTPAKGNNVSDADIPVLSDKYKESEELNDKAIQDDILAVRTDVNDVSDVDTNDKPPVDRVTEENDSTLNVESNSKNTVLEGDEKSSVEMKLSLKNFDEKEESLADVEPDALSDDHSSKETDLQQDKSSTKVARKIKTTKQPRKEKQAPKRKAVSEALSKPRGRKKVNKINFDGDEGSISQKPGRTSSRTNRQTRQGLSLEDFIVSDDDEWQSDRSEPKPRRKRGSRRGEDSGSDWEVEHKKPKKPLYKVLSGSESGSERGNQRKRKGLKEKRKKNNPEDESNEIFSEEDEPQASSSNKDKDKKPRIPCKYGKKCYRRHPNHRNQFSHPGESDYTSETETNLKNNDAISESDGESPKKECPYGVNCFRKNPQHKKDFKHTKKVRPQREAAKQADKKAKSSRNSDEVDNYDLNDSFLNDDSDEYKPVDSGSDYESGEKVKKHTKGVKSKRGKKA